MKNINEENFKYRFIKYKSQYILLTSGKFINWNLIIKSDGYSHDLIKINTPDGIVEDQPFYVTKNLNLTKDVKKSWKFKTIKQLKEKLKPILKTITKNFIRKQKINLYFK
jgi:hypothetical protein